MQLFILPFDFYLDNSVNSDMVLGQNNKIFETHISKKTKNKNKTKTKKQKSTNEKKKKIKAY